MKICVNVSDFAQFFLTKYKGESVNLTINEQTAIGKPCNNK